MSANSYDAVVIGSGMGGLTAGALLAAEGRKVCVLERNHSFGGAASAFKHGALTIEPSLHQTADPRDKAEPKHEILQKLGLLDEIEWVPVSPFFTVRGGPVGAPFALPVGFDKARDALTRRFPASAKGLDFLLTRMETLLAGLDDLVQSQQRSSVGGLLRGALQLRSLVGDWRASLDDMFTRVLGDDEGAKFALAGNLGYYADDPRKMWWPFFAIAQGGFLKSGGVYIKGGSRVLSMKLAKIVTRAGGVVLLGRKATGVEIDASGRARVVRHADARAPAASDRIEAKMVFANCAPDALAAMLDEPFRAALVRAYGGREMSTSLFSAHFGLNAPPAKFGLETYGISVLPEWLKSFRDFSLSSQAFADDPGEKFPAYGIANFGAIDSGLAGDGPTLVSVVGVDRLGNWTSLTPEQERTRREKWLDAFQAALDRDYPGFSGAVVERQFLNARSMHNFMHTPEGAVYGFAPLPPSRGIWAGIPRSPRTPVANLYLASSFTGSGGFTGAMRAGAEAVRVALAHERKAA
jgi:phytoene dehydrogenase-like protein